MHALSVTGIEMFTTICYLLQRPWPAATVVWIYHYIGTVGSKNTAADPQGPGRIGITRKTLSKYRAMVSVMILIRHSRGVNSQTSLRSNPVKFSIFLFMQDLVQREIIIKRQLDFTFCFHLKKQLTKQKNISCELKVVQRAYYRTDHHPFICINFSLGSEMAVLCISI